MPCAEASQGLGGCGGEVRGADDAEQVDLGVDDSLVDGAENGDVAAGLQLNELVASGGQVFPQLDHVGVTLVAGGVRSQVDAMREGVGGPVLDGTPARVVESRHDRCLCELPASSTS